jgi:TRAP-type C4-dicarboxylate transport system permease small subunit
MNRNRYKTILKRTRFFLCRIEDSILVGLLATMIGMAFTQICLRNFFEGGIYWGDKLVRILVLWLGLVGAMVASRQNSHISIDVIARYFKPKGKNTVSSIVSLFTATVCSLMAYYSLQFVKAEFEFGVLAFAKVPAWVCEAIIPFAFAVIALRFFMQSITNFKKIFNPQS